MLIENEKAKIVASENERAIKKLGSEIAELKKENAELARFLLFLIL